MSVELYTQWVSDYGTFPIPPDVPRQFRKDGWISRPKSKMGRMLVEYFSHQRVMQEAAYLRGDNLAKTFEFQSWAHFVSKEWPEISRKREARRLRRETETQSETRA